MNKIFWCNNCNVPLISSICGLCGKRTQSYFKNLRLIFEEERKLYSKLLKFNKLPTIMFRSRNMLIVNGKILCKFRIQNNKLKFLETNFRDFLFKRMNRSTFISRMILANKRVLLKKEQEAITFIKKVANINKDKFIVVSFSGGKDSTVTAYLVRKALKKVKLIFSNTGIEFPETVKFAKRFAKKLKCDLIELRPPKDFFQLCKELGPPSRTMRWCCFTQKSAPINEYYTSLNKFVLSFDGIRKEESRSRAKFNKIRKNTKIIKQYSAYPIFNWSDFEVWLYILWKKLPINPLYYYGFNRIGCWLCPNNGKFDEFLLQKIYPKLYNKWKSFLIEYAKKNGKTLSWIDGGKWKERRVKYKKFEICAIQNVCTTENEFIFTLNKRKVDEFLLEFFKVFGKKEEKNIGDKKFIRFISHDISISTIINGSLIRVKINDEQNVGEKLIKVIKQLKKALNCINCGGCIGTCSFGAIKIINAHLKIDESKCINCLNCISSKYLDRSCIALHYKDEQKTLKIKQPLYFNRGQVMS